MLDKILNYHKKTVSFDIIFIAVISTLALFISIIYFLFVVDNRLVYFILFQNLYLLIFAFIIFVSIIAISSYQKSLTYSNSTKIIIMIGSFVIFFNLLLMTIIR
ncbi:MAG: hypothetical protein ACP5UN_03070 [Candidatus Micrarchaeia archaeon]